MSRIVFWKPALTPALSPKEREHGRRFRFVEADRRVRHKRKNRTPQTRRRMRSNPPRHFALPLLGGEGRGEGGLPIYQSSLFCGSSPAGEGGRGAHPDTAPGARLCRRPAAAAWSDRMAGCGRRRRGFPGRCGWCSAHSRAPAPSASGAVRGCARRRESSVNYPTR